VVRPPAQSKASRVKSKIDWVSLGSASAESFFLKRKFGPRDSVYEAGAGIGQPPLHPNWTPTNRQSKRRASCADSWAILITNHPGSVELTRNWLI
jgi:hypothetical protein